MRGLGRGAFRRVIFRNWRGGARRAGAAPPLTSGGWNVSRALGAAAIGATGLFACFALVDPALHLAAKKASPAVKSFCWFITDIGRSGWVLWPSGAAIIVLAILFRREASRELSALYQYFIGIFAFLFAAITLASIPLNILKIAVGRARPKLYEELGAFHFSPFYGTSDYFSFPSGHTATAFAIATAFSFLRPGWRIFFFVVAIAVGVSRVILEKHYAMDVVAGAAIGLGVAILVQRWFMARGILFARRADGGIRLKGSKLRPLAWRALRQKFASLPAQFNPPRPSAPSLQAAKIKRNGRGRHHPSGRVNR